MWKDKNLVFLNYKSKSISSVGVHKKPSAHLSTNLYGRVYFEHRDQFNGSTSMGSSDTWSDNSGQAC